MSPETLRVYARIAKHWDAPEVQDYLNKETGETSINGFLKVIRRDSLDPPTDPPALEGIEQPEPDEDDLRRSGLREQFRDVVKELSHLELRILTDDYKSSPSMPKRKPLFEHFLDQLIEQVQHGVALCFGGSEIEMGEKESDSERRYRQKTEYAKGYRKHWAERLRARQNR